MFDLIKIETDMINIGDKAPEILGHDENGKEIKLSDYSGQKLVLYFYPKDSTSGCTTEACNFRDERDAVTRIDPLGDKALCRVERVFAQFGIGIQMKKPVCIATTGLYMLIRPII